MLHTHLPFFTLVRVSGDDRCSFLHGQLSNDIINLQPDQACYATYNTPQGRVIANMLVMNTGTELLLAMASDLVEYTIKRLKMFVLRAKVQFEILENWGVAAKLDSSSNIHYPTSPALSFAVEDNYIQLPHGGQMAFLSQKQLPSYDAKAEKAFQEHEIRSGYAWISEATRESCVAQMLNQHNIGGIHFRKGCYPGQEIIARAQYRGQVKRGVAIATALQTLTVGSQVNDEKGENCGIIINTAGKYSLVVIKHSAAHSSLFSENQIPLTLEHCFFEQPNS